MELAPPGANNTSANTIEGDAAAHMHTGDTKRTRLLERSMDSSSTTNAGGSARRLTRRPGVRLIDREASYHQSKGKWNIKRKNVYYNLYMHDFFHTILNQALWKIAVVILIIYAMLFLFFGLFYYAASDRCDLRINNTIAAYYFSMETMMTIGYDSFTIGGCGCAVCARLWEWRWALEWLVCVSVLFRLRGW